MDLAQQIKAIIFDYDDTLVCTREVRYKTIKKIADVAFRSPMEDAEIDAAWGLPGDDFLIRLFGRYGNHTIAQLWEIYNEFCATDPNRLYHGVNRFLDDFSDTYRLGILTSSSEKRVGKELDEIGLARTRFVAVQTAEDSTVHKPNPQVFEPICHKFKTLGIDRNNIVYIGDTLADFKAATGFGLQFLGMAHSEREKVLFQRENIKHFTGFDSLSDFLHSRE